jgi:hypothetical protein
MFTEEMDFILDGLHFLPDFKNILVLQSQCLDVDELSLLVVLKSCS